MLLYIPLLSSVLALYQLGAISLNWFRTEILLNAFMLFASAFALYTDSVPAAAGVFALFFSFAIVPLFFRRYIARKMVDPSAFTQFWAFKCLSFFTYGLHSRATILMWKGIIGGAKGQESLVDSFFEEVYTMDPPPQIKEMALVEHLRALALVRSWDKLVSLCSQSALPATEALKAQFQLWYGQGLIATGEFIKGLDQTHQGFVIAPSFESASFVEFSILSASALSGQLERTVESLKTTAILNGDMGPVFSWYWRGRCHIARGEKDEALHCLMMAQEGAVTTDSLYWKGAVSEWLDKCESDDFPVDGISKDLSSDFMAEFDQLICKMKTSMAALLSHSPYFYENRGTRWLIGLLVIIYLGEYWFGAVDNMEKLLSFGAFMPALVLQGDYFRLITAVFLHGSLLHLLFNVLALQLFGPFVENCLGLSSYLAFFVITGVAGNLCGLWPVSFMVAVGASGGVMGILGASMIFLIFDPRSAKDPERNKRIKDLVFLLAANLVIGQVESSVFNGAHIGGLITGAILAFLVSFKGLSPLKNKLLFIYRLGGIFLIISGIWGMYGAVERTSPLRHFTKYAVSGTGWEVNIPSHWLVDPKDEKVLRAYGFDGTRILFFAVQPPDSDLFSDELQQTGSSLQNLSSSALTYIAFICFQGQKDTKGVVLKVDQPQFAIVDGKEIAFFEYESDGVRWYDQIEIRGKCEAGNGDLKGLSFLMGRIVTPAAEKENQLKLFSKMYVFESTY
jgi:membrane associated rhomboid family serine protease